MSRFFIPCFYGTSATVTNVEICARSSFEAERHVRQLGYIPARGFGHHYIVVAA